MIQADALLFDMDGVLVNSFESWFKALNHAVSSFDLPTISRDEFKKTYWGHDLYDNLKKAGLNQDIGPFCNSIYAQHIDHVSVYPLVKETLQLLDEYKKAVITNTPESCALQILERFSLAQFFDVVVTSDQVQHGKPDPEIIYKACCFLKVEPEQAVVIGDTSSDVIAGKKAGCTVIGVGIQADYTIQSLHELLELLQPVTNV